MIKVGDMIIVPINEEEAVLAVVLLRYTDNVLRVAEVNAKGVPLKSKRYCVREQDVTPCL